MNNKPEANLLFEVSWEVCNKVGGIYTVLISKAARIIESYGANYFLIGPYFPNTETVKSEFQEEDPPEDWRAVLAELKNEGMVCHFGTWVIEGSPKIVLIDFNGMNGQADWIKTRLWEDYGIDSLTAGHDFTEPIVWGWAVGRFLEKIVRIFPDNAIVAQFHEWLSGVALLYIKKRSMRIGTVFTTHATTLGRTLANNGVDLYTTLFQIDTNQEAYRYNVQAKHQLERQSAQNCDALTTVSEIAGWEVDRFLGRSPDVILPNGLDIAKFPTFEEIALKHKIQRDRIRDFVLYYFFPYYSFNIERTLFYFIACRYEFYNKGIHEFIMALGDLNKRLKKEAIDRTVVSFFFVPTKVKNIRNDILEARENYRDIKDSLDEIIEELKEHFLYSLISRRPTKKDEPFLRDEELLKEVNNKMLKFRRNGVPPLATHDLGHDNDLIINSLRENGLENRESDKVKVIFYPTYLTGSDGLLNLNYYETIEGCHLGVFPSLYEPWGYTTLETAALGVTAITTDLSGLGKFLMHIKRNKRYPGIFVLNRYDKTDQAAAADLAGILFRFAKHNKEERIKNKIKAKELASLCDWKILIEYYLKAHNLAIAKINEGHS